MSILSSIFGKSTSILTHVYEKSALITSAVGCRYASKKTGGSTRNCKGKGRPKHRGLKVGNGAWVSAGSILVLQLKPRFHPGLNVGFGKNGTLFAMENGQVVISCEKIDPDMEHTWIQRHYGGRDLTHVYKKYLNVIAEEQHNRFKLIDSV